MEKIVVYSPRHSARLQYIADWLLRDRMQLSYTIITDPAQATGHAVVLAYGAQLQGAITIPDSGLLWQQGIQPQEHATGSWNDIPTLYCVDDSSYTLPFDIFSAIFFLLSRHEEYLPFTADKHGRYPPTCSILHKKGWLQRPLIDEWIYELRKLLQPALSMALQPRQFVYQPTYDIDMAYSHLHKGVGRIVGAYIRALLKVDVKQISERTQVLKKKQKDPYDSFRWLRQLHKEYGYRPVYFVLSCFSTTKFDKNIHPEHPAMVRVIKHLAKEGAIGIHPSYYSDSNGMMASEKQALERVAGSTTAISRQHYIRVKMPDTYRLLLQNGITADYTMGYGSKLGFRAGTGSPFLWYDLEREAATNLQLHPFCFMDTTAHYEGGMSVSEAFEALQAMTKILERTGSTLVTIFHNFSLGTSAEWKGWRQAYEHFLQQQSHMPVALPAEHM